MGLYPGDILQLANVNAAAVALVDATGAQIGVSGALPVTFVANAPATSTLSAVSTGFTGSQVALASNPNRKQAFFFNDTNKPAYLAYAGTSSTGAFTFQLPAGGEYNTDLSAYTGIISVIWANAPSAGHALHVTEVTP